MKKTIITGIVLITLSACGKNPLQEATFTGDPSVQKEVDATATIKTELPADKPTVEINTDDISKAIIQTVSLGEQCGGPESMMCESPLFCSKEIETKESFGTCVNTVVDASLECGKEQVPVCGQTGHRKNTYLNKCEAERHGAEIVNQGFCGRQNAFEKPCEAPVLSVGECEQYFVGYSFDGSSCQEKSVMGCDIDAPFKDKATCVNTCK